MRPAMAVQLHGAVGFTGPACTSRPSLGTSAAVASAGLAGSPPGLETVHQPCDTGASALATIAAMLTTPVAVIQSTAANRNRARRISGRSEEDGAGDVVLLQQVGGATLEPDLALLQEDRPVTELRGDVEALFDDDDREPVGVEPPDDVHQLADDNGGQPQRQLIDAQQLRVEEQRLRERQLLLLAAGELARLLGPPLCQPRERGEDPVHTLAYQRP